MNKSTTDTHTHIRKLDVPERVFGDISTTTTPRTDEEMWTTDYRHDLCNVVNTEFAQQLERELAASQAEVERLREALDTLTAVVGLTPVAGNKVALQEAYDLARQALNPTEK